MANRVMVYKSTDLNAPVLSGVVGGLITVLDACLVNGYSTAACTSIARGGPGNLTALVKLTTADTTLYGGTYVTISGCTSTGASVFNVTAKISTALAWIASTAYNSGALVINDSGKTFVCRTAGTSAGSGGPTGTSTGISDGTATWDYVDAVGQSIYYFTYIMGSDPGANASGSPAYNKASAQWGHPFTAGTHAQTYRSADTSSNQFYLQVIDNAATAGGAKEAQVYGAEAMSADQTVTSGRFPTSAQFTNGLCIRKSTTADSTARAWTLIADDRTFYFINNTGDAAGQEHHGGGFGYFIPFKAGDAFNTFIGGAVAFNSSNQSTCANGLMSSGPLGNATAGYGLYVSRSYTQIGTALNVTLCGYSNGSAPGGIGQSAAAGALLTYPNPVDNGLYVHQLLIGDVAGALRGRMPGFFSPLHANPFVNYDQVNGITGLSGATMISIQLNTGSNAWSQCLFDIFGPWT